MEDRLDSVLRCENLAAGYNGSTVFSGLNLSVGMAEKVCILGRNGVGKTTLLKSIMAYLSPHQGKIFFLGHEITEWRTFKICKAGISFAPEGRGIFQDLSVADNFRLAGRFSYGSTIEEDIYNLLPTLKRRRSLPAGRLSGGEQQVLAIGCALLRAPRLLIIDELSEGLQPSVLEAVVNLLRNVQVSAGMALLFVEQSVDLALSLADRAYIMDKGGIAFCESSSVLLGDMQQLAHFIAI